MQQEKMIPVSVKSVGVYKYPSYETAKPGDAGLDLRTQIDFTLKAGESRNIPTGLCMAIPLGLVGMVCSRSGLAAKHQIEVLGAPGIVDSGYRGEIRVTLKNHGTEDVSFKTGDRIAQLLFVNHSMPAISFQEVEELDETERGAGGFGSTSLK